MDCSTCGRGRRLRRHGSRWATTPRASPRSRRNPARPARAQPTARTRDRRSHASASSPPSVRRADSPSRSEPQGLVMKLSQFFIGRPIFAGVLSALIFLAGLIALPRLPISEYPEVVPPTVVVKASYPGANPKVIAETVASPLEQSINGVEGMLYQSSQATADGLMTLTIT